VELTYASVVSRDSVRIAFLLSALNDLDVLCADVGNVYINAPCRGKYWILCGPEFGPELDGCWAILVRALYGLRTSAASWRTHLYQVLQHDLNFVACLADPDVMMRVATRADGQGSNQGSQQVSDQGSHQGSHQGSDNGTYKVSDQVSDKGSNQGTYKVADKGTYKGPNQGTNSISYQWALERTYHAAHQRSGKAARAQQFVQPSSRLRL
jgi:hypothetical protein